MKTSINVLATLILTLGTTLAASAFAGGYYYSYSTPYSSYSSYTSYSYPSYYYTSGFRSYSSTTTQTTTTTYRPYTYYYSVPVYQTIVETPVYYPTYTTSVCATTYIVCP